MASLSTERNSRKMLSGDRDGPPLRHLKQINALASSGDKVQVAAYCCELDA
jgi:hypothetical protein